MNIKYKMLDSESLLCKCMHGGPVFEEELGQSIHEVDNDTVCSFTELIIEKYGSNAILAIDTDLYDAIVGVLFFYPKVIYSIFSNQVVEGICIQTGVVNTIKDNLSRIENAPSLNDLNENDKILGINCMFVVSGPGEKLINNREISWNRYLRKGIGDGLLVHQAVLLKKHCR